MGHFHFTPSKFVEHANLKKILIILGLLFVPGVAIACVTHVTFPVQILMGADRTLMAWIRTSLSMPSFGLTRPY